MKLIYVITTSGQVLETCHALLRACSRFNLIMKERRKSFLPHVYIKFPDHELRILSLFNSKIKVSMQKVLNICCHFSGVALRLADIINNNKWRSAWLVLFPEAYSVQR